ncbi:Protein TAPETUM DETERMINANT 1 [Striga hermonthica]|uniref:Protein TAPETUM DETERMINANT 1 n=1 Tax=Striga hermonthica TaxID=68872 RepID=A0A9N7R882_STRHE|nr:Protein TAPETUM DETERMINANT 1 [Striga hermonthica]
MANALCCTIVITILFICLAIDSKLLSQNTFTNQTRVEPNGGRRTEWKTLCPHVRIQVSQGVVSLHGIPRYSVIITNLCTDCWVAKVHFHCQWFASATLVPPNFFERVAYDDCVVYGGRPMPSGKTIQFVYSNTYSYPLSVASFVCWP